MTLMQKSMLIIILIGIPAVSPLFAQSGEEEDFKRAVELYRGDENENAIVSFESFLERYPDSLKVDDAYWYLGRLYLKVDNRDKAVANYKRVFEWPERSSRLSATLYDLAKIYYKEKNYQEVIALLGSYEAGESLNRNDLRFQYLAGKSYYRLGYRNLNDYKRAEASEQFGKAIELLSQTAEAGADAADRLESLIALGETYLKALDAAESRLAYSSLYNGLAGTVSILEGIELEEPSPDVEGILRNFKALKGVDFSAELEGAGGFSTLALTPGFQLNLDLGLTIPLGFRQELKVEAGYDHDSFSFKSFNFLPEETGGGDIRLIQSTDELSGKLSWNAGSRKFIYSRFSISGGYGWADDPEDNFYTLKAAESLDFRLSRYVKTGIDGDFRWKVFPNYLINGRKLDYILGTVSPFLDISPVQNVDIKTAYQLEIKQYLDAKYEAASGVAAEKNRQYLVNSGEVSVDGKFWSFFRPGLGYTFTYHKSNNFNVTVNGLPGDLFVEGYYDYYEHEISAKTDFRWSRRLKIDLDGSVAFRNFINYPARDETKTFTGDIRKDTEIKINGRVEYIFWPEQKNRVADIGVYIEAGYINSMSNMTYENSFATNYDYATFLLGLHIDLP